MKWRDAAGTNSRQSFEELKYLPLEFCINWRFSNLSEDKKSIYYIRDLIMVRDIYIAWYNIRGQQMKQMRSLWRKKILSLYISFPIARLPGGQVHACLYASIYHDCQTVTRKHNTINFFILIVWDDFLPGKNLWNIWIIYSTRQ